MRDLIDDGIREAKENLTRALLADIRAVAEDPELDELAREERYAAMQALVWEYYANGELDSLQQEMLRELLQQDIMQVPGSEKAALGNSRAGADGSVSDEPAAGELDAGPSRE